MRASGLRSTRASPATLLAGRGSHRRGVRRRQAPGTSPARRPARPRSSGTSGAVPSPGDVRRGRAERPYPRGGKPPGTLPRPTAPASAVPAVHRGPAARSRARRWSRLQRLQGNPDEPSLQHEALAAGHRIAEQRDHPVIRGQPQRPVRCGEFSGPGGFPGCGEPDHQDQRGGTRVLRDDGSGRGRAREWFPALCTETLRLRHDSPDQAG